MERADWVVCAIICAGVVLARWLGYRQGAKDGKAAGYYAAMQDVYGAEMGIDEDEGE